MANYTVMTNALKDLFHAICRRYDLVHARVIVFAFGKDEFSGNLDGYWIVAAVEFLCDTL